MLHDKYVYAPNSNNNGPAPQIRAHTKKAFSVFFFLFVQSRHVSYSFGHFFAHLDRFNDFKFFSMP